MKIEVITPEKKILSEEADFIAAPAADGEVGILPGHAPLLAKLGVGIMRIKKGSTVDQLAISGGFLKVQGGQTVSVFAETAEMGQEIDVERARQAAERAKSELAKIRGKQPISLAAAEADLKRALLRLKVADTKRRKAPSKQVH